MHNAVLLPYNPHVSPTYVLSSFDFIDVLCHLAHGFPGVHHGHSVIMFR